MVSRVFVLTVIQFLSSTCALDTSSLSSLTSEPGSTLRPDIVTFKKNNELKFVEEVDFDGSSTYGENVGSNEVDSTSTTETEITRTTTAPPVQIALAETTNPETPGANVPDHLQYITPEQKKLLEQVTKYGLDKMRELYLQTEPTLYKEGIFLTPDSPGSYLAQFNAQSPIAKNYSLYAYAALRASEKLKEEIERAESRQELSNLTRAFPQISLLDTSLHDDCPLQRSFRCPPATDVFRTPDGTCNNRHRPWWGSPFTSLKRYLPPHYDDGLEAMRRERRGGSLPSARLLSTSVHWDQPVNSGAVSHLLMQWGQFIDHDMMCMLRYTRQQMRLPLLPEDTGSGFCRDGGHFQCFKTGDRRVTEQPGLIAMHTLFLRFHNRLARQLAHTNKHWSDERLFQETRKIVGAVVQHITYNEFLPVLLGKDVMEMFDLEVLKEGFYRGYRPDLNPAIANAFATAAYRFGHSMVQSFMLRWHPFQAHLQSNGSLHEELFDTGKMHREGAVDSILVGMTIQASQARDEHVVEELTNHLFQTQGFPAGLDLAAINIQRGRDHGLPPYHAWRAPCGLRRVTRWEDLKHVMSADTSNTLRGIYSDVDDIDLFTGGLSEFPVRGGVLGSTFACIIAQQFSDLRRSDRFWYELGGERSSFTPRQLAQIRRVTLARILCDNLDLIDAVQPFVFLIPDEKRNGRLDCRSLKIPVFTLLPWEELDSGKWVEVEAEEASSSNETLPEVPFPDVAENVVGEEVAREIPMPIPVELSV